MNTGLARALRRFFSSSTLLAVALAGASEMLFAEPELPSADVDRVIVRDQDGRRHEITDRAAVARLARFVRERGGWGVALPPTVCWFAAPDSAMEAQFYRGGELRGWIGQQDQTLVLAGEAYVLMNAEEMAEIRRLMRDRDD